MNDKSNALPTINGETPRALSEIEAAQLGRIVAQQLGSQASVEQLTAQRLRLAHAFAPERRFSGRWHTGRFGIGRLGIGRLGIDQLIQGLGWLGTRPGAALLGGVAAALVVGVGLGGGKVGVGSFQWNQSAHVELSPEPLRVVERDVAEHSDTNTRVDTSKGTWRNRGSGVVVADGWLRAEREPLFIDWVQRGASVAANSVRLDSGARARVLSAGDDGLVLSLEHGNVVVQGEDPNAACEVFAGPYAVRSGAASYELGWSTDSRELALRVNKGQAVLEASVPLDRASDEGASDKGASASVRANATRQVISAGQSLRLGDQTAALKTKSKETGRDGKRVGALREQTQAPQLSGSNTERDTSGQEKGQAEAAAPVGSVSSVHSTPVDSGRWKALAESGQYREAVAAATEVGFDVVQAKASASDLLLLADAARLGGAANQARAALQLLRQNFPTHTNAAIAAFTLGRMAQELDHNDTAALKWYRTYLRQEPQGRMAEGARARVLKGALRVGTTEEVQAAARDYLAHHPSGSSARLARQSL